MVFVIAKVALRTFGRTHFMVNSCTFWQHILARTARPVFQIVAHSIRTHPWGWYRPPNKLRHPGKGFKWSNKDCLVKCTMISDLNIYVVLYIPADGLICTFLGVLSRPWLEHRPSFSAGCLLGGALGPGSAYSAFLWTGQSDNNWVDFQSHVNPA